MHDLDTTLVAGATPPGRGGIACVRIGGPLAWAVALTLFRPGRKGAAEPGGPPRFGRFLGRDGEPVDHGYLVLFAADASFTGEPVAELWPHGNPAVIGEIVSAAIAAGATPAGPGEFTYRALRHGRLDLARAEAVRDLVAARTLYQARVAFAQAEGRLSLRVRPVREALADLAARAEAAVEFAEEAETHLPAGRLRGGIAAALVEIERLLAGSRIGRVAREGATLALAGAPNVGKSSLFNRLLDRDRAIVSAVPGTTRDTLEECVDLGGIPVTLVDTAGLREIADPVEEAGVRRAWEAAARSDLALLVLDASRPLLPAEEEMLGRLAGDAARDRALVALNKSDLPGARQAPLPLPGALRVSALTGEGIEELRAEMRARLLGAEPLEDPVVTNVRHADALHEAERALRQAAAAEEKGLSEEWLLEDLNEALSRLGDITGELAPEDLYDRIFSTFCIGK